MDIAYRITREYSTLLGCYELTISCIHNHYESNGKTGGSEFFILSSYINSANDSLTKVRKACFDESISALGTVSISRRLAGHKIQMVALLGLLIGLWNRFMD